MRKLTILIDMDDVLENLVAAWSAFLNRQHGTTVEEEDITDWQVALFYPTLTNEEVFEPLSDPAMWETLQPMQNAPEIVQRLKNDGHVIRIVTASHYATVPYKVKKFLEMYPFLSWQDVIVCSDKKLISGDILIDDGTHNLMDFPGQKILFDRPHNRKFPAENHQMLRLKTWDEIYHAITKIAKE